MRFIFAHDGIAINVDHIVTIFVHTLGEGKGFVVRCQTTLSGREYVNQHAIVTLSPALTTRESAQQWIDTAVKDIIDPQPEDSPDASA